MIPFAECRQGKRLLGHQHEDEGGSSLMSGLHAFFLSNVCCSLVKKYKTPVSGSLAPVVFIGTPTTFLRFSLLQKENKFAKDAERRQQ
jgi:hypothetical protein